MDIKTLKTQAYEMGKHAKDSGHTEIPAMHTGLMQLAYANNEHMVSILKAFVRGWTHQHLAERT